MSLFNIVIALIAFNFIIFFHELFHYIAGKMMGIRAKEFAVGFGKSIVVFQGKKVFFWPDKKKDTYDLDKISFHLKVLPFGGFVLFDRAEMVDGKAVLGSYLSSFHPFKRIFMVAAGPIGNFLLGFVLFFAFMATQVEIGPKNQIMSVVDNSFAEEIGLEKGDRIVSVNRQEHFEIEQIKKGLQEDEFCLEYDRKGTKNTYCEQLVNKKDLLGVTLGTELGEFTPMTLKMYGMLIFEYVKLFGEVILNLDIKEMSGPVGVLDAVQESVPHTKDFLGMLIMINIALGVANLLFPLSITDGGKIIVNLICWVRKKNEISTKYLDLISFLIILVLFTTTTYFDLKRLFINLIWFM